MNLNQIDIIVSNVPQVCADLEHILDKKADYADDSFAQFTIGSHCLMLSQNHLIPLEDFQSGIILHIEVEDLNQNYQRLKDLGIQVLNGPAVTDWGILKTEYELLKDRSHPVFLCCMKAIVTLE